MYNVKKMSIPIVCTLFFSFIFLLFTSGCNQPTIDFTDFDDATATSIRMIVKGNNQEIVSGGNFSFDTVKVSDTSEKTSFSIEIETSGLLKLDEESMVAITGVNADEFTLDLDMLTSSINNEVPGQFFVTFNPTSAGSKSALLTIKSTNSTNKLFRIFLTGKAEDKAADLQVIPLKTGDSSDDLLYDFDKVVLNSVQHKTFEIANNGEGTLKILSVYISGDHPESFARDTISMLTDVPPMTRTFFKLTCSPTIVGTNRAKLSIITNDPNKSIFTFRLTAEGIASTAVVDMSGLNSKDENDNPYHNFGTVLLGDYGEQMFILRNMGETDLEVTAVTIAGKDSNNYTIDDSSLARVIQPHRSSFFTVSFLPRNEGNKEAYLNIVSNDRNSSLLTYKLVGQVSDKKPILTIEGVSAPNITIDMKNNEVNTTTARTFKITNTGTGVLTISDAIISGQDVTDYQIDTTLLKSSVQPKGSTYVTAIFAPKSKGIKNAELTIFSNDETNSLYPIKLTGTGYYKQPRISITGLNWIDVTTDVTGDIVSNTNQDTTTDLTSDIVYKKIHDAGLIETGTSTVTTLSIKNEGEGVLDIYNVEITGKDAKSFRLDTASLAASITAKRTSSFNLIFTPDSPGKKEAYLTISSNDEFNTPLVVEMRGESFIKLPGIEVIGLSDSIGMNHDFGNVYTDTYKEDYIIIHNDGEGILNIESIYLKYNESANFEILDGNFDYHIAPHAQSYFTIRFNPPQTGGNAHARLVLVTNVDGSENVEIGLAGQGTLKRPAIKVSVPGSNVNITSFDFPDSIKVGTAHEASFVITNDSIDNGNGTLEIRSVTISGAGVTDFTLNTEPLDKIVFPGASTLFSVRFSPSDDSPKNARIMIITNDPNNPTYTITLTGTGAFSEPEMRLSGTDQTGGYDYKDVIVDNRRSHSFTIRNTGDGELLIYSVNFEQNTDDAFSIDDTKLGTSILPGRSSTFTVTFAPGNEGAKIADLLIMTNDTTNNGERRIALAGNGIIHPADISIIGTDASDDSAYGFGGVPVGSVKEHAFIVRNAGNGPLSIYSVNIENNNNMAFILDTNDLASTILPGRTGSFKVRFTPVDNMPDSALLKLHTNDPDADGIVTINLSGQGTQEKPAMVVKGLDAGKNSATFLPVKIGNTRQKTFEIENTGAGPLEITKIYFSSGEFTEFLLNTSEVPEVIPPNRTGFFSVAYKPVEIPTSAATLTIVCNDEAQSNFNFNVIGSISEDKAKIRVIGYEGTNQCDLNQIGVGIPAERKFTIYNEGTIDLKLEFVKFVPGENINSGEFTIVAPSLENPIRPDDYIDVTLQYTCQTAGEKLGQITIASNDPMTPLFVINTTLTAFQSEAGIEVIAPGDITVDPSSDYTGFGTVELGETASRTFSIFNTGNAPLNISTVRIDQGNLFNDYSLTEPAVKEILPNSSVDFTLKFAPVLADKSTSRDVTIVVNSDAPVPFNRFYFNVSSQVTIKEPDIKLENTNYVEIIPDSTDDAFEDTALGESTVHTYTIFNTGEGPLVITSIDVRQGAVNEFPVDTATSNTKLNVPIGPGESTAFTISFAPRLSSQPGLKQATVWIETNVDVTNKKTFKFGISGNAIADDALIEVHENVNTPDLYNGTFDMGFFTPTDGNPTLTKELLIYNTGTKPLNITDATISDDMGNVFSIVDKASLVNATIAKNSSKPLRITFTPGSLPGIKTARVRIFSNSSVNDPFEFAIKAETGKPEMAVYPPENADATIDNNSVFVITDPQSDDRYLYQSFVIENTSDTTNLVISEIKLNNHDVKDAYALILDNAITPDNPLIISPKARYPFQISFDASNDYIDPECTIMISNNDVDHPVFDFDVKLIEGFTDLVDDFETQDFSRMPWELSGSKVPTIEYYSSTEKYSVYLYPYPANNSILTLKVYVKKSATLSFKYRKPSNDSNEFFDFSINETAVLHDSYEANWTTVSYSLTPGCYTLQWKIFDSNNGACSSQAFLDDIRITGSAFIPLTQ